MESYRTEEEQVEAIKRWWDENGKSTVVAIVVAVAVSFGWRYWQDEQQAQREAASVVYQQLLDLVSQPELSADQRATAKTLAAQIDKNYSDSGYAVLAGLAAAKVAIDAEDFASAASVLASLKSKKLSLELAALVNLRLAKVQFSQQDYTAALQTLAGDMQKFAAQAAELRGDIYAAQGQTDKAHQAYVDAQSNSGQENMLRPSPLLRIKLEAVASTSTGDNA